jgi:hypothetical protein
MSRRVRSGKAPSLLLLVVLALLCCAPVQAVGAAEEEGETPPPAAGKLQVLSPKEKLEVELAPGEKTRSLEGSASLLVRNGDSKTAKLEVQYLAAGKAIPEALPGGSGTVFLEGAALPQKGPIALGPGVLRPLALRFQIDAEAPADAIDGQLILTLVTGEEKTNETTLLPVSGVAVEAKSIAIQPESLTIEAGDSAELRLAGQGLADFLKAAETSAAGVPTRTAVVSDGSGESVRIEIVLPKVKEIPPETPHEATATVRLAPGQDPSPGSYSGKVALAETPEAPTVTVTVKSHECFLLMVLFVLIGVIAGGLVTRVVSLAARRTLLLLNLQRNLAAFRYVSSWQGADGRTIPASSWRLEDLLDEPEIGDDGTPGSPTPKQTRAERLQGIPGLIRSIETARSAKDLDEDTVRVLDVVARLQRWLRVEPAARRLAAVANTTRQDLPLPGQSNSLSWEGTRTWQAAEILREAAKQEPKDVDAADVLVTQLLWQAEWHHHVAEVWEAVVEKGDGALGQGLKKDFIDKSLDPAKVLSLTPEERDKLDVELTAFICGPLKALGVKLTDPPGPDRPTEKEAETQTTFGVTPVKWSASPNLFTGWATLDAKSYGQLVRRATSTARANTTNWLQNTGFWATVGREIRASRPADLAWTFVALFIASVAYAKANYGDTWGSTEDIGTALMAGLLGTATVNWAALPIFRSIRLRQGENEFVAVLAPSSPPSGDDDESESTADAADTSGSSGESGSETSAEPEGDKDKDESTDSKEGDGEANGDEQDDDPKSPPDP